MKQNLVILAITISSITVSACRKTIETEVTVCEDDCKPFNNDGECDDGGEGSTSDLCRIGTDCSDCGERIIIYETKVRKRDLPQDSLK